MHEHLRNRLLGWWASLISVRPGRVLAVSTAMLALSVAVTLCGIPGTPIKPLAFQSDRNALIDEHLDWNRRFIEWNRHFEGTRDLVIVVDTQPGGARPSPAARAQAQAFVTRVGQTLLEHPDVNHAVWGYDSGQIKPQAMRLLPMPAFKERLDAIAKAGPIVNSPNPGALLNHIADAFGKFSSEDAGDDPAGQLVSLAQMLRGFSQTLADPKASPLEQTLADVGDPVEPWHYLTSDNQRLYFIRITPVKDAGALNELAKPIASIRKVIAQALPAYPLIQAGLTGIEVIEADETDVATIDSSIASVLAFVLIAVLLVSAFHSLRKPLLTMASLLFGIGWAFGYATVFVGHLQVISVIFTVILLGLGVDFGIHLATRFELVRHDFPDSASGFRRALRDTFQTVGPGIVTGAVTTAAAFITTIFTDFKGVAEMGHIAAAGVLLCLVAMFSVYPAMVRLLKSGHKHMVPMAHRKFHLFEERWLNPFVHHPRWTLVLAGLLTVASLAAVSRMRFDYDLMALMPAHLKSLDWQKRINDAGGQSIWFAISVCDDLDQARQRAEALRKQPTIDRNIAGVGMLFPYDEADKLAMIAKTRQTLGLPATPPPPDQPPSSAQRSSEDDPEALPKAAGRLAGQLGLLSRLPLPEAVGKAMAQARDAADDLVRQIQNMPAATYEIHHRLFADQYALMRGHMLGALDPRPLTIDDLPRFVQRIYRSSQGKLALEIYPDLNAPGFEKEPSPLSPRFLPTFVQQVYKVDPNATGVIVQFYRSGELIQRAYLQAGLCALLVVFVLVLVDFQSLYDAVLCLVPVTVGFAATGAVMWLLGMKVNPANIIVLPLMFGIGVDAGVHILHRYRQDPIRRPLGLTAGTGKGIMLTSMTTIIGFGCLMIASHRGIQSLGFVMAMGMAMTLLACLVMMPAWLELRQQRKSR